MGRIVAIVVCALALIAPPASATTTLARVDGGAIEPWQGWIASALMPVPNGTVAFVNGACPATGWSACYESTTRTIYMAGPNAGNRAQFLHELGHDFDATVMTDAYRAGFVKIMRYRTTSWEACAPGLGECQSAQERFATGYSLCGRRVQISADVRRYGPGAGYGYRPTPSQHQRVCALIRRAAG